MLGLERGWWGNGVGDGWEYSLAAGGLAAAVGGALGVLTRRSLRRPASLSERRRPA